jgi:GMP synthase (glutamine-hydrolysing)
LDDLADLDRSRLVGTVVYGGPFVVTERQTHTFLTDEHRWVEHCLANDLPLLGICQGAQSIAHVLGARVGPPEHGKSEFGYYEIRPTGEGAEVLPAPLWVSQNHFHEFGIPAGAVRLAESDSFDNQAFKYGTCTYGFQFHPEGTIKAFRRWQQAPWARWSLPGAQTIDEQTRLMYLHDAAQAAWFFRFLERLFLR